MKTFWFLLVSFSLSVVCSNSEISVISKPYASVPRSIGDSLGIELSADGRWAAITSSANGLVPNFPNQSEFGLHVYVRNLLTGETTLVSRNANGAPANGSSIATGISADGRFIVFESDASDLVADDDNDSTDVFLYDRTADKLSLVSRTSDGIGDLDSSTAKISPDGRYILYESEATNLSSIDDNDAADLFLLDRDTGETELVTANFDNSDSGQGSESFALDSTFSTDGRYVAFLSVATNHVPNIPAVTNAQLYIRDMTAGTNAWISRQENGDPESYVTNPVLSSNGTYLAFIAGFLSRTTTATNLSTGNVITIQVPGKTFVCLYSTISNTLKRLPLPEEAGTNGYPFAYELALSADGRFLVYSFAASRSIFSLFPLGRELSIYDTSTESQRLVPFEILTNGTVGNLRISADGQTVLFTGSAGSLSSTNNLQLYAYSQVTGETKLVSRNAAGDFANEDVVDAALSADGSMAGFVTLASNLSLNDDPQGNDVFTVSTVGTNSATLASAPQPASVTATASGASELPGEARTYLWENYPIVTLSLDGRYVLFSSNAPDLATNKTNEKNQFFVHDLLTGNTDPVNSFSEDDRTSVLTGMSADGNVVFYHQYTPGRNLTSPTWVYAYDVKSRTNRSVAILPDGTESNRPQAPDVSMDGRYVLFMHSDFPNVVPSYYVRDLTEQKTVLINWTYSGPFVSLSAGGKYLLFGNSTTEIFDWRNNTTNHFDGVAVTSSIDDKAILFASKQSMPAAQLYLYLPGQNSSNLIATNISYPTMSLNGSVIAYGLQSEGPQTNLWKTFVFDVANNSATALTINGKDVKLTSRPSLSPDGRYMAFTADASGDGYAEVHVFDRVLNTITLVSRTLNGGTNELPVGKAAISADGHVVVFDSISSDLVPNDFNLNSDVFVARLSSQDSDSDGLEDGWEIVHFGNLTSSAAEDPDHDGSSNLNEFLGGTDPNDITSNFTLGSLALNGQEFEMTWKTVAGKTYQLQFCPALGSGAWQDVDGTTVAISSLTHIVTSINGQTNRFYRLKLVE